MPACVYWLPPPLVTVVIHNDVMKWNYFPRYWPFVRRIHRSSVDSSHKGQWREVFMFSLICAWTNSWANNRYTGDLWRHCNVGRVTPGFTPITLSANPHLRFKTTNDELLAKHREYTFHVFLVEIIQISKIRYSFFRSRFHKKHKISVNLITSIRWQIP